MPEAANFRSPNADLYKAAAARRGLRLSDWLREAADYALRSEGFSAPSAETATQYALVTAAGEIVAHGFRPGPDDRGEWLPIENRDSATFDPAQHWRLKPLPLRLEGEVVVREYPVVAKSQEHA